MSLKITEIKQAVRNPERVNIYLNGKFWIGLGKSDLIAQKLVTGMELSESDKQKLEAISSQGKILEKALVYATMRPRSINEVRSYLVFRKHYTEEEAEKAITYLLEHEYLSDEKFALWYAEYKMGTGVNGTNKIKVELLQKGVNRKLIDLVLEKITQKDEFNEDQYTKIKEFAEKVVKTIKAKDAYDLKSKLIGRLLARGFKYDEIKKVLQEIPIV